MMFIRQCNGQPDNNISNLLSGLDATLQQQPVQPATPKRTNNISNLLSGLQNEPVQQSIQQPESPVAKSNQNNTILQNLDTISQNIPVQKPQHSTGNIAQYLANLENAPAVPSAKKTNQNKILLQNFLQKTQSPLYKSAMSILSNKELQNEYRQNMVKIQLKFMDYTIQQLQSFHVHASAAPPNLTSMLNDLSGVTPQAAQAPKNSARNNVTDMLSSISTQNQTISQPKDAKSQNNSPLLASFESQG